MIEQTSHPPRPTHEEIETCAYFIFIFEGRPEGRALSHWLEAELQLCASRLHEAANALKKENSG